MNNYKVYFSSVDQPIDCQWSAWSQYSLCSKSCDGGLKWRTRFKTVHESNGGVCNGYNKETISCSTENCSGK